MLKKFQTERSIMWIMLGMFVIILGLWWLFSFSDKAVQEISTDDYKVVSSENDYLVSIDTITASDSLIIQGWCVKKETEYKSVECRVVLQKEGTQQGLLLPTMMQMRPDVTETVGDGFTYNESGFVVSMPEVLFDLDRQSYKVFVLLNVNGEEVLLDTGKFIGAPKYA